MSGTERHDSLRVATDLRVPQVSWWGERLSLPRVRHGTGVVYQATAAIEMLRLAFSHDVVITANLRNALAIGLFKRLTGRRRPRHVMVELRLDDPRSSLLWKAKLRLQQYCYATVDRMCVSARREGVLYSSRMAVPEDRFRFVPWHTNVLEPGRQAVVDEYVFSAGRTGRDWRTLADAAIGMSTPVVVVCDSKSRLGLQFPPNVTVHTDISYDRYQDLLKRARIVVVPLEPHIYSSGQVVILEAMALGKPVIVSDVLGTEDYVQDGVTGLLVPPGDARALRLAIERVASDRDLERALGEKALEQVRRQHTLERYLETILGIAEESGRSDA